MQHDMMRLPVSSGASDNIGDVLASIRQLIAQDTAGCRISDAALNAVPRAAAPPGKSTDPPCVAPLMLDRGDLVVVRATPGASDLPRPAAAPLAASAAAEVTGTPPPPAVMASDPWAGTGLFALPDACADACADPAGVADSLPPEPSRDALPDAPPLATPTVEETMLHVNASVTPITPAIEPPAAAEAPPRDGSEMHLFAPDEKSVQKGTHLRGMIREAIRQELQGEIGNRLSRNLQAMIRQEVELTLRQMCEQD